MENTCLALLSLTAFNTSVFLDCHWLKSSQCLFSFNGGEGVCVFSTLADKVQRLMQINMSKAAASAAVHTPGEAHLHVLLLSIKTAPLVFFRGVLGMGLINKGLLGKGGVVLVPPWLSGLSISGASPLSSEVEVSF